MDDFSINDKLSNEEIRKRILEYKYTSHFLPSADLLDSILEQFWFHDFYNSFISDSVFLNYLIQYLDKCKQNKFNRYNFYKFLFDRILTDDLENRKIIYDIAVVFESLQADSIKLLFYKQRVKSIDKKNKFSIETMQKYHLAKLEEKDGEELFRWQHHSLTEYLTAKFILSHEDYLKVLKKYLILEQEGVVALKPSWFGVLRFLLESEKGFDVINWLISFLEEYPENIDDAISELIVFEDFEDTNEFRSKIFNLVYITYQSKKLWIPVWARSNLSRLINKEIYKRLKKDLKVNENETDSLIHKGNIVPIIGGLVEVKSDLLSEKELIFWKKTFIEFTKLKIKNSALKRQSLDALSKFKDESIIKKVAENLDSNDSLTRDAFLQLCGESAPNSHSAIDAFVKGLSMGSASDIYARNGLYRITQKNAVKYFLSRISKNGDFLEAFLEHESIFDKENADKGLVRTIAKFKNDKFVVKKLKETIYTIFEIKDVYQEERSAFIKSVLQIIAEQDKGFLLEVLGRIKNKEKDTQRHLFYDYDYVIVYLLNANNVGDFFRAIEDLSKETKDWAYRLIKGFQYSDNSDKKAIFEIAEKFGKVQKEPRVDLAENKWESVDRSKKRDYNLFIESLNLAPKQFKTDLFRRYVDYQKEVEEFWTKKDKNKFVKLALSLVREIDPKNFQVKLENKSSKSFRWSKQAEFYLDLISTLNILVPGEIKKHKQKIINFIPFTFSPDKIIDFVPTIRDKDLEYVNVLMGNDKDDRRYLIPGSYIYVVQQYVQKGFKLPNVLPILKSFLSDKNFSESDRNSALSAIEYFITSKDIVTKKELEIVFKNGVKKGNEINKMAEIANAILIKVYKDNNAINWRFRKIKERRRFKGFVNQMGFHEVGEVEEELMDMVFAKPLIELKDKKYMPKFLGLLNYSFKTLDTSEDYWNYVSYLWKIIIAYVDGMKIYDSFVPLFKLEKYIIRYSLRNNLNWLLPKVQELRRSYIDFIGRQKSEGK